MESQTGCKVDEMILPRTARRARIWLVPRIEYLLLDPLLKEVIRRCAEVLLCYLVSECRTLPVEVVPNDLATASRTNFIAVLDGEQL